MRWRLGGRRPVFKEPAQISRWRSLSDNGKVSMGVHSFILQRVFLEPNELRIGVSLAAGSSLFISSAILPLLRRSLKVFLPAESNFSIAHVLSHQPEHRQPASTSQVLLIDCLALWPIQHHFQVSYFKCTPSRHHSWPKGTQPRRYTGISCDRCQ